VSKTYFSAGGATKWNIDYKYSLVKFFSEIYKPYKLVVDIPFPEPLRSSIRRFLLSVEAYSSSRNPVIPEREILDGVTNGPAFATYLKRVRFKSFINTTRAVLLEKPEWWEEVPSYHIDDIGDIFNYQYLIHWEEDIEDYQKGFLPLKQNAKMLNKFRKCLKNLISDTSINLIDEREILLGSSGSICIDSKYKKHPTFKIKGTKENFLSKKRGPCRRSVIQVHPEGGRDAVINQLSDLNRIKLIEYQTAEVLKIFSSQTVSKDLNIFEIKYKKFKENHKWFLCRDLTKEGITKPRSLLKIMMEELHNQYPDAKAYEYTDFFDDYEIIVNDEILKPIRGHGLGMANALTTLMQLIIFQMTIEKMNIDTDRISLLTHNDDAIVGTQKRFELELFWDAEEDILRGLDLLRNPKKSFLAKNAGVFLEKYFSPALLNINKKESYQRRELFMAYCATNIVQAKQLVSSQVYLDRDILTLNLEEIVTFWGYEFFPEEIHYPAFCGGWYNEGIYGVSTDLKRLEELEYDHRIIRAYLACKNSRIKPKWEKGTYHPPVSSIFPLQSLKISEDYYGLFDIGSLYDVKTKYTSIKVNPELYKIAWDKLRQQRLKTYLTSKPQVSFKRFIRMIVTEQDKDFIPLDWMIEKSIETVIQENTYEDPYESHNVLLSYLSSIEPIEGIKPNEWGVIFSNNNTISAKLTADQRKRLKVVFGNLSLTGKLRNDTSVFPKEDDDFILIQSRTFATMPFLKVCSELNNPHVPILKEKYVNPKISKKKTVWGRYLTVRQYMEYSRNLDSPNIFKVIMDKNLNDERIDQLEIVISKLIQDKLIEETVESEDSTEPEHVEYQKTILIVPSPENYKLYLTGIPAWGEAKIIFSKIFNFKTEFDRLEFEMFASNREDIFSRYRLMTDIEKEIWIDAYGDPESVSPDESEDEAGEGFDLFG